jgi:hypothetical protein
MAMCYLTTRDTEEKNDACVRLRYPFLFLCTKEKHQGLPFHLQICFSLGLSVEKTATGRFGDWLVSTLTQSN